MGGVAGVPPRGLVHRSRVLELIAADAPLAETLAELLAFLKAGARASRCDILIVTEDGAHLRQGAGSHLPEIPYGALEPAPMTPPFFSPCAEAADKGTPIVVPNIAHDTRYSEAWRSAVLSSGVAAVHAAPVLGAGDRALACFAIYYERSEDAMAADPELVVTATNLAAIALEQERARRRSPHERLNAAQHHILSLVEHSEDAIVGKDLNGIVTSWNGAAERLFGYTADEMIGRSITTLMQPDQRGEEARILARIRHGEHIARHEAVLVHKDGHTIPVSVTISPIVDTKGRIIGASRIAHDITARKKAEGARRQNEESLRRLNENLEERVQEEVAARQAAQARLRQVERMEALSQLAGGIAHDFNNVLQTISSGIRLIRHQKDEPEAIDEIMSAMSEAADRGASVTRRLLTFARRAELRAERVNVTELLAGLHEILARRLGARIAVRVDAAPGLALAADTAQLEAALINLAANARDAMPEGGTLQFTAALERISEADALNVPVKPGTYVRLAVTDDGDGMDSATLVHASEPFFTTKPAGKGTGLGLAGARGFAEQSGGGFAIESALGRGTTVTLWFPAATRSALPGKAKTPVRPPPQPLEPRLLLVADERAVREMLAREMEKEGCSVVPAASAAAVNLLKAGEVFDLLISALVEPGTDGTALLREAERHRPPLPAILLGGSAATTVEVLRASTRAFLEVRARQAALAGSPPPPRGRAPDDTEERIA